MAGIDGEGQALSGGLLPNGRCEAGETEQVGRAQGEERGAACAVTREARHTPALPQRRTW